jgi:2'-5' RNA ligase
MNIFMGWCLRKKTEYYALVHYPKLRNEKVEKFRKKYDPLVDIIEPHITLIFPLPANQIDESQLVDHINKTLSKWRPFDIHMTGLKKSWDCCLFLLIKEGGNSIIKLHDELYTGILAKYLRKDIEFIPHITLGLFVKKVTSYDLLNLQAAAFDEKRYETALKEARKLHFDYMNRFDRVRLIKSNEDLSKILETKEFKLGS